MENGIHVYNETDIDSNAAEKVFAEDDRVVSTNAIFHDQELLSGITVKTFSRFKKDKIEKDLKKKLEEVYPELKITVSADNKIVHKTTKIMQNKDKENLGDDLKKLGTLLEEET